MKAEGKNVISFGAGEPDFNTPDPICDVAVDAIRKGFTKYTPSSGIRELKDAIVAKLARENELKYQPDQIVVSCGAKHSLYNALQMLIDPGDEVILLAPYWMSYYDQVRLAQGVPVVVHGVAEHNFEPELEAIEAAITKKTRLIMVNSPNNPTGAVYSEPTLRGIAEIATKHNLWIVSDEIYERLVFNGARHHSMASFGSAALERTLLIGGCSKTYAMTGWRIGFTACPLPVAKAMSNFQDQVTSNPSSISQKAAVEAFSMDGPEVENMRLEFEGRRNLAEAELGKIPGLAVPNPQGAFYFFLNVSQFLGGSVPDDVALSELLLERAQIAMVPGSVFDAPGHLRLSYTASRDQIIEGIARLGEALTSLTA